VNGDNAVPIRFTKIDIHAAEATPARGFKGRRC